MVNNYLKLLRFRQWLKNLMLFFPPFLGGTLFIHSLDTQLLIPFSSFCLVSSATYIINDVFDKTNDRHHPAKSTRPIASGQISIVAALLFASALFSGSLVLAWNVSVSFLVLLLAYFTVSLAYSAKLKEIVLVDLSVYPPGF